MDELQLIFMKTLSLILSLLPFLFSPSLYVVLFLYIFSLVAIRIRLCLVIYRMLGSSMFLLLFFEPLSIAFETLQVMLFEYVLASFGLVGSCDISELRLTRLFHS